MKLPEWLVKAAQVALGAVLVARGNTTTGAALIAQAIPSWSDVERMLHLRNLLTRAERLMGVVKDVLAQADAQASPDAVSAARDEVEALRDAVERAKRVSLAPPFTNGAR